MFAMNQSFSESKDLNSQAVNWCARPMHGLPAQERSYMRLSKSARLLGALIVALGLLVWARSPSQAGQAISSSAPRVAAYMITPGLPMPDVNWNS
jgi:hypothetical protein